MTTIGATSMFSRRQLLRGLVDVATRHQVRCQVEQHEGREVFAYLVEDAPRCDLISRLRAAASAVFLQGCLDGFPEVVRGKPGQFAGYGAKVVLPIPSELRKLENPA